jgi:hypothetical protein
MLKKSAREVLKALNDGGFIPIRLGLKNKAIFYYKLFKIEPTSDTSIQATLQKKLLVQFRITKGGKPFPVFL